jgi:hypothetical protein
MMGNKGKKEGERNGEIKIWGERESSTAARENGMG